MPTYLSTITMAGGARVTGIPTTPTAPSDAVNQSYVDSVAQGLSTKDAARAATLTVLPACTYAPGTGSGTGAGVGATLTANANGLFPLIDGVDIASFVSDPDAYHLARVLVKNQADSKQNGIYQLTAPGVDDPSGHPWVLTRATDCNTGLKMAAGSFAFVEEGTQSASGFVMNTPDPITLGTSLINWALFSDTGAIAAGIALSKSGNTLDVRVDSAAGTPLTTTLALSSGGTGDQNNRLKVANGGVTDVQLATDAVIAAKILAGAVTAVKLNADVPGTGISLTSVTNKVQIADLYVSKRYTATVVGDGTSTIAVAHGLSSKDVQVTVRLPATGMIAQVDMEVSTTNLVNLLFAANQSAGDSYRVAVVALPATTGQPAE